MDPATRDKIVENLTNEWKYLLIATETWAWLGAHPRADQDGVPLHTLVLAMDAAFLHGRNLYEFFGKTRVPTKWYQRPATVKDFDVKGIHTPWWHEWESTLHARLFHMRLNRKWAQGPRGRFRRTAINKEVVAMRDDLLAAWAQFLDKVTDRDDRSTLERAMQTARLDLPGLVQRLEAIEAAIDRDPTS